MNNFFQDLLIQRSCTIDIFDNEYDCILNIDENKTIYITREQKNNDSLWIKCFNGEVPKSINGHANNIKFTMINTMWVTDEEDRITGNAIFINKHIDFKTLKINNFQFSLKNIGALFENNLCFALDGFDLQIKKDNDDASVHIMNNVEQEFLKFDKMGSFIELFINIFSTNIITRKENFSFVYGNSQLEFMNTPKYLNNELNNRKKLTITFSEKIVQEFYQQYEDFPLVYQRFYDILANYEYLVLENKFLAFAQILEAIDRGECNNEFLYPKYILYIFNKLGIKQDCSNRKHLKYLWKKYNINNTFKLSSKNKEKLINDIVNIRNTLTHIKKNEKYNTDNFIWITKIMKLLIIYIFSNKSGIEKLSYSFNGEIDFYIKKYITK